MNINYLLEKKINQIKFESYKDIYHIMPFNTIEANKNTFALIFTNNYNFKKENKIYFIQFFSYINDNFISVGKYNFNDKILVKPYDLIVQIKVENENLIYYHNNLLILEEMQFNNGQYSFKNIILPRIK